MHLLMYKYIDAHIIYLSIYIYICMDVYQILSIFTYFKFEPIYITYIYS